MSVKEAEDRVEIRWFTRRGYAINGIVHVGANDGYEVQWYQQMGIKHILCFEPLVTACERFKANYPDTHLVECALGNIDGFVTLHVTQGDGQGSSTLPEIPGDYYQIATHTVPIMRLASWGNADTLLRYNCLVVDTQGTELDVLRGMDELIKDFDFLNIECSANPIYKGGAYADEVISYLKRFGFIQQTPTQPHGDIMFVHESALKNDAGELVWQPPPEVTPIVPRGTKLNIGSGQRRFDTKHGWVNVDCIQRPPEQIPDLICDVGKEPLPYPNDSMEICVLHQVYEHFGCGEGHNLIKECHRVLKPGGSLIITVPNMRTLSEHWLAHQIEDYIYFVNVYGAYQGLESDRHKWGYGREALVIDLEPKHWESIKPFDWRPISGADIARDWWILGMECVK